MLFDDGAAAGHGRPDGPPARPGPGRGKGLGGAGAVAAPGAPGGLVGGRRPRLAAAAAGRVSGACRRAAPRGAAAPRGPAARGPVHRGPPRRGPAPGPAARHHCRQKSQADVPYRW